MIKKMIVAMIALMSVGFCDNKIVKLKFNDEGVVYVDTSIRIGDNLIAGDDSTIELTTSYKTCFTKSEYDGICKTEQFVYSLNAFNEQVRYKYINRKLLINEKTINFTYNTDHIEDKWYTIDSTNRELNLQSFLIIHSICKLEILKKYYSKISQYK